MNKDLIKTLSELKNIAPGADYSVKSRNLLLAEINKSTMPKKVLLGDILAGVFSRRLAVVGFTVITLILAVSGSALYINNELNQQSFVAKANEVNASIKVKLDEIQYLLGNKEISYEKGVIIQTMLTKATDELKQASEEKDTTKSIEKIKSAQEIFSQIDAMLQNK